ncbi:MAG TPA: hypothetical protein G4N95_07230 [Anaerolineae bacterium]|nr:hypothetical protein [Anaerolineae bacterium]
MSLMIIDAHEDLAWNMLSLGRDYTRSAALTRKKEQGTNIPSYNGDTLLGWEDYQRGNVAVVFSTLFAAPARASLGSWDTQTYATIDEAHARYKAQLDAYHRLTDENPDKFKIIHTKKELDDLFALRLANQLATPVGLIILMENAEGVHNPDELEMWWRRGVRIIGPAWRGTRFCGGTGEPGSLTKEGFALLEGMASMGFVLDISHMDEKAVLQSLDIYPGTIIASHANAAALLKGTKSNRFLSDCVIRGLLERDGVVGVVPYNRFLLSGWTETDGRACVSLEYVVSQIDYICQFAGDARHVGFGTDFDGGFGVQKAPSGIDTIADLQKIAPLLADKGYSDEDIRAIFAQNWVTILNRCLPGNNP